MKKDTKFEFRPKVILAKIKPILKHHYFFVTIILFGSLAFAIYMVNETLNTKSDDEYRAKQLHETIGSKFNQGTKDTIEKIKSLQKSSDPSGQEQPFPEGRINPFSE